MRTIGRHRPRNAFGDYPELCSVCGVKWYRSQLYRTRYGRLLCRDDIGDDRLPPAYPAHILNNDGTGSAAALADFDPFDAQPALR